jgi:hypothetical protein
MRQQHPPLQLRRQDEESWNVLPAKSRHQGRLVVDDDRAQKRKRQLFPFVIFFKRAPVGLEPHVDFNTLLTTTPQ